MAVAGDGVLSPSLLIVVSLIAVLALLATQAPTRILLRVTVAAAPVPWTLQGIAGVPQAIARMPISVTVILACLGIVTARGTLPLFRYRASVLPPAARALFLATGVFLLSTLLAGSVTAMVPWIVGALLAFALAHACRLRVVSALQILGTFVVASAVVVTWDLLQRRYGIVGLPSMTAHAPRVLERGLVTTRFAGTLGDYELYAEISGLCMSAALAIALFSRSAFDRAKWCAVAMPLGMAAVATGTRGSAVVVVVALAGVCVLARRPSWFVGLALLVASAGALGSHLAVISRFSGLRSDQSLIQILNRQSVWNVFFERTHGHLWTALGHGLNYPYEAIGEYPHNLGLFLLFAGGAVGSAFFIGAVVWLCYGNCRYALRFGTRMNVIVASLLAAAIVDQIKIEFVRVDSYVISFFALLAIGICGLINPLDGPEGGAPLSAQIGAAHVS